MNKDEYARMFDVEGSHWWYVSLHKLILSFIQNESQLLGRPLNIFDAGSGTGRLCQLLITEGHSVRGCDVSEEALRHCRLRMIDSVDLADLNTIEIEPGTYDIITSIDVLYHADIVDDIAVMKRLKRGLKPDGVLILNLVAHEFLRSTHDVAVCTRERYSKHLLCERLLAAGLDIELVTYRVSILFPVIAVYRLFSRFVGRRDVEQGGESSDVFMLHPLINSLLLKIMGLENMLIDIVPLPFGSSLFAIARNR